MLSEQFYEHIKSNITQQDLEALNISRQAFFAARHDGVYEERTARMINGDIVSDSESDDADHFVGVENPLTDVGKQLLKKRREAIKRCHCRITAKALAERRLLSRRVSKKVHTIVNDFPNIGAISEAFVQDRQVGGDQWRRTGVLTFDGNSKLKQKVTYRRIQEHLQEVYMEEVSHTAQLYSYVLLETREGSQLVAMLVLLR